MNTLESIQIPSRIQNWIQNRIIFRTCPLLNLVKNSTSKNNHINYLLAFWMFYGKPCIRQFRDFECLAFLRHLKHPLTCKKCFKNMFRDIKLQVRQLHQSTTFQYIYLTINRVFSRNYVLYKTRFC